MTATFDLYSAWQPHLLQTFDSRAASSCFKDLGRCDRNSSILPLKCKANTQSTAPAPCIFNPYLNLRDKKKNSTPHCASTKHVLSYFRIACVYFPYCRWSLHNKPLQDNVLFRCMFDSFRNIFYSKVLLHINMICTRN